MRWRISSSISRAMKSRMESLHQFPANHVEGQLRSEPTNPLSIAGELALFDLGFSIAGERVIDETDRLLLRATSRPGHPRDANPECGFAAFANTFGERNGNFAANRTVLREQLLGHIGEGSLEFVRIDNYATQEVSRASADAGDAIREQSPRARFGDGQRRIPHLQIVADDLLE